VSCSEGGDSRLEFHAAAALQPSTCRPPAVTTSRPRLRTGSATGHTTTRRWRVRPWIGALGLEAWPRGPAVPTRRSFRASRTAVAHAEVDVVHLRFSQPPHGAGRRRPVVVASQLRTRPPINHASVPHQLEPVPRLRHDGGDLNSHALRSRVDLVASLCQPTGAAWHVVSSQCSLEPPDMPVNVASKMCQHVRDRPSGQPARGGTRSSPIRSAVAASRACAARARSIPSSRSAYPWPVGHLSKRRAATPRVGCGCPTDPIDCEPAAETCLRARTDG
jgi:hypothetical protein